MAKLKKLFVADANGNPCQFAQPVEEMFTVKVDSSLTITLELQTFYMVIPDINIWWRWGNEGLFEPPIYAERGAEDSGLWPANKPLGIYTQKELYFAVAKDSKAGYITFYKNYGTI